MTPISLQIKSRLLIRAHKPLNDLSQTFSSTSPHATHNIIQFSSVTQLCPTVCDHMDCSTPGFPVHHQLPELAQIHVHWIGDAIQPSHPLLSPSPPSFNIFPASGSFALSQFFASGGQSIGVSASASVSELQHQSFQWIWPCGQCYVNIVGSPHWWNVILQPGCIRCYTCPGEKIGRKQNSESFEVGLEDCSDVEEDWILEERNKIELIRWEELQKKSKFLNMGSIPLRVRVK